MLGLALVVLVSSLPEEQPCGAERQAMALEAAQKVFPKAAVAHPCRGNALVLQQLLMTVDGVELQVNPRVVFAGGKWKPVPFDSADGPAKLVKQLRELKLFGRLEARGKVACLADSDAPGQTRWFRCSTDPWDPQDTTPTSGHLDGSRTELEVALDDGPALKGCTLFRLANYSVPGDMVELAPYFGLVAELPEVKAFREQHRTYRAMLTHWHEWSFALVDGASKLEVPLVGDGSFCGPPLYAKGHEPPAAAPAAKKKKGKKR